MTYFGRNAKGGLRDAGQFLQEGGDDMREACDLLMDSGRRLQQAGLKLPAISGGLLIERAGQDIARGAEHAFLNKLPFGQGWFMISNAGVIIRDAAKFRNSGRIQMGNAGDLITSAGHLIIQGGGHLVQAGRRLGACGLLIRTEGVAQGLGRNHVQAGELIHQAGQSMAEAGEKVESGCSKITQTIDVLNEHGRIVVKKGRLMMRGNDIILTGKPGSSVAGALGQTIVRWGATLRQRIQTSRLGLELPSIVQQMRPVGAPLRPGEHEWDWLDNGLNDANNLDEYEKIADLGQGAYGMVTLNRRKDNHLVKVAIKRVNIYDALQDSSGYTIQREKKAGKTLQHQNICSMLSCFNHGDFCYFILEFCDNGSLDTFIENDGGFTEEVTKFYSAELVSALIYISGQGWVHRDIKPENILLSSQFHLKLSDFGLAKHTDAISGCCVDARGQPHVHRVATGAGTLVYMSPESVQPKFFPTMFISDIYALGANIYTMMTNEYHVDLTGTYSDTQDNIIVGNTHRLTVGYKDVRTNELCELYSRLIDSDYRTRLGSRNGYADIVNHPWYAEYKDNLERDNMYTRTPPPFKQPAPSGNPHPSARVQGPIIRPQLQLRGQSFFIQQPHAGAGAGASLGSINPATGRPRGFSDADKVFGGDLLQARHRDLGKNVKLGSHTSFLLEQQNEVRHVEHRPLARSLTHVLGRVGRPRTRSEGGLDPATSRTASFSDLKSHRTLRTLLDDDDDEDDDDTSQATGGQDILYTLDLASDPADADIFSPQSQNLSYQSADRSQFILQNHGTFPSPGEAYRLHASQGAIPRTRPWHVSAPDSTPRRRPVFTIGGEVIGSRENIPEQYLSQSRSGSSSNLYTPQQSMGFSRTKAQLGSLSNMTGQLSIDDQSDQVTAVKMGEGFGDLPRKMPTFADLRLAVERGIVDPSPPPTTASKWSSGDAAAKTPPPRRREQPTQGQDTDGVKVKPPVNQLPTNCGRCQSLGAQTTDASNA